MNWDEIDARIANAVAIFLSRDEYLITNDVNERSLTHKFAEYLQAEFPDWNVDCEYNRLGSNPKMLDKIYGQVPDTDLAARTVYPDIIVHHRGADNLLVIEAKRRDVDDTKDRMKLFGFTHDHRYSYPYAGQLIFAKNPTAVHWVRFNREL